MRSLRDTSWLNLSNQKVRQYQLTSSSPMLTFGQVKIEDCPSSPPVSCHAHIGPSSSEAKISSPLCSRDLSTHASLQSSFRPIIPTTYTTSLEKGDTCIPTTQSLRAAGFIHPSWPEARSRAPYVLPRGWYRASDGNGNTYFYNGSAVAIWLRPTEIPGLRPVTQDMVDRYNNPRAWAEPSLHTTKPTETPNTPPITQGLVDRYNTRARTEEAGMLPQTPEQADVLTNQPEPEEIPRSQQPTPSGSRGAVPYNASSMPWKPRRPSLLRYEASARSPENGDRHAPPELRRSRSPRSPPPALRRSRSVERSRGGVRLALDEDKTTTTTTTTTAAETKPKFYSKEPFSYQKGKEHIQTCYFWNDRTNPRCTNGDRCQFMHECSRCHSMAHGRAHCDSDLGEGYRRGPRREGNVYSRR